MTNTTHTTSPLAEPSGWVNSHRPTTSDLVSDCPTYPVDRAELKRAIRRWIEDRQSCGFEITAYTYNGDRVCWTARDTGWTTHGAPVSAIVTSTTSGTTTGVVAVRSATHGLAPVTGGATWKVTEAYLVILGEDVTAAGFMADPDLG